MKVNFRVISVNEDERTFVVRYFTDILTEDSLANDFKPDGSIRRTTQGYPIRCRTDYNLSFMEDDSPSEEAFVKKIISSAPNKWLRMKEKVLDKANNNFNFNVANNYLHVVNSYDWVDPFSNVSNTTTVIK